MNRFSIGPCILVYALSKYVYVDHNLEVPAKNKRDSKRLMIDLFGRPQTSRWSEVLNTRIFMYKADEETLLRFRTVMGRDPYVYKNGG